MAAPAAGDCQESLMLNHGQSSVLTQDSENNWTVYTTFVWSGFTYRAFKLSLLCTSLPVQTIPK